MRGFLLLSVVGALLYGLLLLTADVPDRKAEHSLSGHTERPADRTLRSWGSNLPALVSSNHQMTGLARRSGIICLMFLRRN